jgi:hypothetical protein
MLDLTKTAREHSILHHVLKHGPSEKDHAQSFKFTTKNDFTFQQLSAKIVEWSETHQLMRAVTQPDFRTIRRLLDEGVKINLRKTLSQMTALHVACQMESSKFQDIDLLVRIGKADVTLRDSSGRTALHYALLRELPDVEIIRVLLEAGAETTTQDHNGVTPWDLAESGAPERVRKLLRIRPLVNGPSATKGSVARAQPHSRSAKGVCNSHQMAATEMYFDRKSLTEKHLPRRFSISDAIYGAKTLQRMLDETRTSGIEDELVCRWYHLPANNMVWAEVRLHADETAIFHLLTINRICFAIALRCIRPSGLNRSVTANGRMDAASFLIPHSSPPIRASPSLLSVCLMSATKTTTVRVS